jgi:hypothetical protein
MMIAALSAALPAGSWLMSARADAPTDPGEAPASRASTAKPQAASGPSTRPSTSPATTKSAKDQSAEEMLSQMLKAPQQAGKRPLTPLPTTMAGGPDKKSGAGAVAPSAPVVNVLREGTFLVDRIGRLSRTADGSQAEFVFESDGTAMQDPPLVITPNLKLQQMEDAVSTAIKDPRFRVSGTLTEYRGRNYILLDKVVVVPDILEKF